MSDTPTNDFKYGTKVEITNEILWPPTSDCECHGPYAHPVKVALEHQAERRFWEILSGETR